MPHEIEVFADGQAAIASAVELPWHRLGYVAPGPMTAAELLDRAYLARWDVRKVPVPAVPDPVTGQTVATEEDFLVVRTHPTTGKAERLGMVGTGYQIVHNEEVAEFLQLLVDESGAIFETGGSLAGGRRVFLTVKLPDGLTIGGVDRIDLYIAAFNRHDGWGSFTTVATPVRVVCANTERAALGNYASIYRVRHTRHVAGRIAEARQALRLTWRYAQAFEAEAEKLISEPMNRAEFDAFAAQMFPLAADAGQQARRNHDQAMRQLADLFTSAETTAAIRGTRWAAYNTVTEYLDHHARVTGPREPAVVRAERALVDDHRTAKIKERAFNLLRTA